MSTRLQRASGSRGTRAASRETLAAKLVGAGGGTWVTAQGGLLAHAGFAFQWYPPRAPSHHQVAPPRALTADVPRCAPGRLSARVPVPLSTPVSTHLLRVLPELSRPPQSPGARTAAPVATRVCFFRGRPIGRPASGAPAGLPQRRTDPRGHTRCHPSPWAAPSPPLPRCWGEWVGEGEGWRCLCWWVPLHET